MRRAGIARALGVRLQAQRVVAAALPRAQLRQCGVPALAALRVRHHTTASQKPPSSTNVADTFQSGSSSNYIDAMYLAWRADRNSVHKSWDAYFSSGSYHPPPEMVADYTTRAGTPTPGTAAPIPAGVGQYGNQAVADIAKIVQMVRAFQVRGHLTANIDPLGLMKPRIQHEELSLELYGFTEADLQRTVDLSILPPRVTGFLSAEAGPISIGEIYKRLKDVYCGNIGYQYMHIPTTEQCNWIRERIETRHEVKYSKEKKRQILERLMWADHYERFVALKWSTTKRFGLEGAEATIPALKAMIDTSSINGANHAVLGMPHRGRLAVLATVMRKPLETIFCEFNKQKPGFDLGSGDVKYHLGFSNTRLVGPDQKPMKMSLLANPSHLETVNPVVTGKAKAKQFWLGDKDKSQVMSILLHGDAAFAGQGVVYETMGMSRLEGYGTGGTIHVVVNNQIGFTTDPSSSRSSYYSTDLAKGFNIPVFHVNGDDPEAVVWVSELAAEYRAKFKSDVVIDLVCYRKQGHNEADPKHLTQPMMYRAIDKMIPVVNKYSEHLIKEGIVTKEEVDAMSKNINGILAERFEASKTAVPPKQPDWFGVRWQGTVPQTTSSPAQVTGYDADRLKFLAQRLVTIPEDFNLDPFFARRKWGDRVKMAETGKGIDWGFGEALAFASLLDQGYHVRLSGQDVERGTFAHRHAVLHDQKADHRKTYVPLQNLHEKQAPFHVFNSSLSEYGVLGFELGYSMEDPKQLVLWEAQFGDFANGAQIMIDQYIASQEAKWYRQSGLVMLLPHGYEGSGPEHSSARLERYLQLSDDDPFRVPDFEDTPQSRQIQNTNWQVVNCTTPANYYHVLRRQVNRQFRKPLIVMTPKSLLGLPLSNFEDFVGNTHFRKTIPEPYLEELVEPSKVKRVVFCTGKVYYDLLNARRANKIKDVAICRVEQISPFPFKQVAEEAKRFSNAEVVWCQEEPLNNGAFWYIKPRVETAFKHYLQTTSRPISYVGRPPSASPAVGNEDIHKEEQAALVKKALFV